jgi:hypothetical protein
VFVEAAHEGEGGALFAGLHGDVFRVARLEGDLWREMAKREERRGGGKGRRRMSFDSRKL